MKYFLLIFAWALSAFLLNAQTSDAGSTVPVANSGGLQGEKGDTGLQGEKGDAGLRGLEGQDAPNALEILEKVDSFYNKAWNRLCLLFLVIGAVIPAGITYFARKQVKQDRRALMIKIGAGVRKSKSEIAELETRLLDRIDLAEAESARVIGAISVEFEKNLEKNVTRMERAISVTNGQLELTEGDRMMESHHSLAATICYLRSASYFIEGHSSNLLELALKRLVGPEGILLELVLGVGDGVSPYVLKRFDELKSQLLKYGSDAKWGDYADRLDRAFKAAVGRSADEAEDVTDAIEPIDDVTDVIDS